MGYILQNNKRKIIFIIIAIILVLFITAGTTFLLMNINKPQEASVSPEEKANTIKLQAIEALKGGDTTQAKTLFEEAKQDYTNLGDTNNVVDTEAQLYLIEHSSTQSNTINTDPTASLN